jgi:hypothetical protein
MLDVLESVGEWRGFVSGLASLEIVTEPGVLRLRHELGETGGFVVAQGTLACQLSARYSLAFQLRYQGDPCTLEVKFVSPDGKDVWRATQALLGQDSRAVTLSGHEFEYAWGERGAGRPSAIGRLEFAIVASHRSVGRLEIELPQLVSLPAVDPLYVSGGRQSGDTVLPLDDGSAAGLDRIGWCPAAPGDWLQVDMGYDEVLSGVHLRFADSPHDADVTVECRASSEDEWSQATRLTNVTAHTLWIPVRPLTARWLRLLWSGGAPAPTVTGFTAVTLEQARTPNDFVSLVAHALPRGHRPATFLGEQVWWTCVSAPDAGRQALLSEHGAIEFGFASPTLEPSWSDSLAWHGWQDARSVCALENGLPLPTVNLHWPDRHLRVLPQWVSALQGVQVRYEWINDTASPLEFEFLLSLLPFQISPPSQQHGVVGGRAPVHSLHRDGAGMIVNGQYRLTLSTPPAACRIATGVQSDPRFSLQRGPEHVVDDDTGNASAVWVWTVFLAPGASWHVDVMVSELGHPSVSSLTWPGHAQYRAATGTSWRQALAAVNVELPASRQEMIECWRLCVAHILGNRQGAMINPGPRRYARSWIRDAATMGEALLKADRLAEVMAFVEAYAPLVGSDGYVPCCIDLDGTADPLVEHDSHGQWIALVAQVYRYTGDMAFLQRHADRTYRVADYIMALRRQRLGDAWCNGARQAACGLIPESVSHEGYLAQPVHSYWDDLWCLRGLLDAAWLASALGDAGRHGRYAAEASDFKAAIYRSIETVQRVRGIDYVPGSVEWADLDPSASACGPAQLGFLDVYPGDSMHRTMTLFMAHWRERVVNGRALTKYSAYDIRVVRALVNLDRREEAHELLEFLLADRRPLAWHQWPEISWPDPASAGHVGDLPHTWISAEYVLAIRSCLIEETEEGLILVRGVPLRWLEEGPVTVRSLPTRYGPVGYRLWIDEARLAFCWLTRPRDPVWVVLRLPHGDEQPAPHDHVQYFPLQGIGHKVIP